MRLTILSSFVCALKKWGCLPLRKLQLRYPFIGMRWGVMNYTGIPVTYDALGRILYHPDFHPNHGLPWKTIE